MQLNDHLHDDEEGNQFHNPGPIDEFDCGMQVKSLSYETRQNADSKQDAPSGPRRKERLYVAQIHAGEDGGEQQLCRFKIGRTENGPGEGNEAEGDETGDGDGQPIVAYLAKEGLGGLVYGNPYAVQHSPDEEH